MGEQKQRRFTMVLFGIYIVAVVWIILLKMEFSFAGLYHRRAVNLIPFAGSVIVNGEVHIAEIMGNVLIFIPFGVYACMLKRHWPLWKKILPVFLTSLLFEVLQFAFAIGASDITDLIGNTLGGVIGIGLFHVLSIILKEKTNRIVNVLACTGTTAMVALIGLLLIVNM